LAELLQLGPPPRRDCGQLSGYRRGFRLLSPQDFGSGLPSSALKLPPIIGHRGAAARAPENTLAGLRRAKALGCTWVEFDVRLTADGAPVLCHDCEARSHDRSHREGGGPKLCDSPPMRCRKLV
jgi:hypothetical protein